MPEDNSALVKFVQSYALGHYTEDGWDVIVEAWTDDEISEHLQECGAIDEASSLDAFKDVVGIWSERQADAVNSAF